MKINRNIKIAYQGEPGAFSHIAAVKHFGKGINFLYVQSFKDVFDAVKLEKVLYGIIPIENTIAGSIHENYDHLIHYRLPIIGEVYLRIEHHLLGHIQDLRQITTTYSHSKALEQCQEFLLKHPWIKPIVYPDTAGGARYVAERKILSESAIASHEAGQIYGLKLIKKNIESSRQNYTRFLIIARSHRNTKKGNKVSLVFTLPHIPGSLSQAIECLAAHGLNLTKIESRPIIGRPWEYRFYLDVERKSSQLFAPALKKLVKNTKSLAILGYYDSGFH